MKICNMRVENQLNPIAIDEKTPLFSFNIVSVPNGHMQSAYHIVVTCENGDMVWDSGKVLSGVMNNIRYGGVDLCSAKRYAWKVCVWDMTGVCSGFSEEAFFETAFFDQSEWHGNWIGENEDFVYNVYRKTFKAKKKIKKARLYICGLGHYEVLLNSEKIGDFVLEPGWTNYDRSCAYSVYDITEKIQTNNAIGVYLGDGMFNVPQKRYVYFERSYGKSKFILQLNIEFDDGSEMKVVSDESFRKSVSPVLFTSIYGGEDYDARKEKKDFSMPRFVEDKSFTNAKLVEAPKGVLKAQKSIPLKVMKKYDYEKVSEKETKKGAYTYHFPENFSGTTEFVIRTNGKMSGHEIKLTPSELLNPDGSPNQKTTGEYSWNYICNDDLTQSFCPKFTYYGFRYVAVEGAIPKEFQDESEGDSPTIVSMAGNFIYPDFKPESFGHFSCSNDLFNKIHKIINQAMLSNIKSIFTDCPHREKLGWLEETHLIGPAMLYNFDLLNLYKKIENDMGESQHDDGLVPDICPEYVKVFSKWHTGYVDSPEWGSAIIINAWYIYKKYNDVSLFSAYYDKMVKYLNYLTSKTHHHVLHHGLGDWLDIGPNPPFSQNTPPALTATAIYYFDLTILRKAAELLGKAEDALHFSELMREVKAEYIKQFYDDQTFRYATGSQAAQAMSLVFGLYDEKDKGKIISHLVKDIKNREFMTTAGDVGHPYVVAALTMFGESAVMNEMMNITDKPGYGFQIKNGATTLTEAWDGSDSKNPHGSQNHFMLGSAEEWFYSGLGGIQLFRTDNSFDKILIKPHFAKDIEFVNASIMHPLGLISVNWKRQQETKICVCLEIPPNTMADFVNEQDGSIKSFGSGKYEFIL